MKYGNITYSTWTYNGATKAYVYDYDDLNRLTEATAYQTNGYTLYSPNSKEKFEYDKQGNIERLWRDKDYSGIDFLQMTYNGNQIKSITDAYTSQGQYSVKEYQDKAGNTQDEMSYDANGNMTTDLDRDIVTIKYNLLNLPELIQFKNGCQIKNTYSADGQKLSSRYVTVAEGVYQPLNPGQVIDYLDVNENDNVTVDGTDYVGNIEYQVDRYFDWDLTYEPVEQKYLYRVHNPEGYASSIMTSSLYGPVYSYYRKDHLGNNREVWRASYTWGSNIHAAATSQRTQYYASGLPWKYNTGDYPETQPYKYNGKEFVEMHGYDTYDFGHRGFYAATDRFTTIDWKAEETYEVSPYSYACNNPVRYRDENGDGFNDLVKGFVNAVTDNTTMGITDQSGTASYDDADDYNTGQAIGNVASVILGGLETIAGGGTAAGGGALAVVGSETVIAIPVGAAVATGGAAMMAHGTMMMAKGVGNLRNPNGAKGKPDHQEKVNELGKKAQSETKKGEIVRQEKKVQGHDSNRRPDVQIVGKNGKTRKIFEAERKPNSSRNIKREAEYKKLGIKNETHKVGN